MKPVQDRELREWLDERAPHGSVWSAAYPEDADGATYGYDAIGWEASIWVLHAIYETDVLPAEITHEDLRQIVMNRAGEPTRNADVELEDLIGEVDRGVLADAIMAGLGYEQGRSQWPGPGWQRLLWRELARRLDVDPFAGDVPPRIESLRPSFWSWPANIAPPGWGSLDREQFVRLVDQLAGSSPLGHNGRCVALYALDALGGHEEPVIYRCKLQELIELYDDDDLPGSPSNIFPDDKSWFVYTDSDLCATKVSGAGELIDQLTGDAGLETVSLNF